MARGLPESTFKAVTVFPVLSPGRTLLLWGSSSPLASPTALASKWLQFQVGWMKYPLYLSSAASMLTQHHARTRAESLPPAESGFLAPRTFIYMTTQAMCLIAV